ncbi:MAG: DNA polymerase III subunit delta' [Armatimonadota bacterium]|nr:DNA polymerase III subunit delta' [Armatimonadota bacterium]MDR7451695.1 DNA polymerase III subunit delta' [Armatimonadota bacterium]MDR7465687.1 DNA polymerase III subunit delta' [Armatimonadota bacterium]MDR7493596.1 DNA polymerase III subunit delta' [Armatimonadota bacterium]MDR7499500.1 DNA polymerase III subunit delta' [Armatimonadota bacterium]
MPFRDLIDQSHAVMVLRTAVRTGRVTHAYLFVGPAGVGRTAAARAFAQLLNCERPHAQIGDACGDCRACRLIGADQHPDVRLIDAERGLLLDADPEEQKKKVIGIAQVRALRREVAFPPLEGRCKVYIFVGADRMQVDAANSLLKILEEPPPQVVIILIAETTVPMLPTVVSRCQLVRFSLIPSAEIEQALISRHGVDPGRARFMAALAGGQLGRAITWAASPEALAWREQALDLLERLETADPLERMDAAEAMAAEKGRLADLLDVAMFWFRDLLVWQETRDEALLINLDRKGKIAELAARIPPAVLSARITAVQEARDALARNVHPRLLLEHLFLRLTPPAAPTRR